MSEKLKLAIKTVVPQHTYDAANGVLKLVTHGAFSVVPKTYDAEIAEIDRQIEAKEARDAEQRARYLEVFEQKKQGGWTQEEATAQEANNRVRVETNRQKNADVVALRAQKQTLLERYNDIKWCWQIAGTGVSAQNVLNNTRVAPGLNADGVKTFHFPKLLEGGGLCWVEGFRETTDPETNDPATGTIPNGLFVQAAGTPRVVRCEWTKHDFTPITGPVGFGSEVLLHIYTEGLFGQEINVGLMDQDYFSFNDLLPIAATDRFIAEINVSEIKAFEIGKAGIDGLLSVEDAAGEKPADQLQYLQKVTLPVLVDPRWEEEAGSELQVYTVVKTINTEEEFTGFARVALAVKKGAQKLDDPNEVYTNNPVVIDQIETNAAHFAPCKYTAVKVTFPAPSATTDAPAPTAPAPIYLFKESDPRLKAFRNYEIVSGYVRAPKTVTVELEEVSTPNDVCRQPASSKHQGRVLKLTKWPEATRAANRPAPTNPNPLTPPPPKSPWEVTGNTKAGVNTGTVGGEGSTGSTYSAGRPELEILTETDQKLSFKARYVYNLRPMMMGMLNVHPIFRYIWIGDSVAKAYEFSANTCRYSHTFLIMVYPDVKWTLGLEFKNNKTRVESNRRTPPPAEPAPGTPAEPRKTWIPIGDKELGLSLKAKWDGDSTMDLTTDITEYIRDKAAALSALAIWFEKVFLGKENKEDAAKRQPTAEQRSTYQQARQKFTADAEREEEIRRARQEVQDQRDYRRQTTPGSTGRAGTDDGIRAGRERRDTNKHTASLKRSVVGLDVLWPNLNINLSWSRKESGTHVAEPLRSRTGIFLEGSVEASPLLGLSCYLDFIALIQRAHPIALAVIAAADLTMALIGDGSKITIELRATGEVGAKLEGFVNTTSGENTFNGPEGRGTRESGSVNATGSLSISLLLQITIKARKNLLFVSVTGTFDASVKAEAKCSAHAFLGTDDKGFYIKGLGGFDGLDIVAKGEIAVKLEQNRRKGASVGGGVDGSIKFQAIDKQEEKELFTWAPFA